MDFVLSPPPVTPQNHVFKFAWIFYDVTSVQCSRVCPKIIDLTRLYRSSRLATKFGENGPERAWMGLDFGAEPFQPFSRQAAGDFAQGPGCQEGANSNEFNKLKSSALDATTGFTSNVRRTYQAGKSRDANDRWRLPVVEIQR